MKGILLFGLFLAITGAGLLYFGIIGKMITKIYTPKKKKEEIE